MKIYSKIVMQWDDGMGQYVTIKTTVHDYDGPVALCCGATSGQKDIAQQQSQFSEQLMQQAGQIFGDSSSVFQDLKNTFAPTVAKGPNQEGFSAAEKANLNSQAITETGQAYKNAKAAVGNAEAGMGGGNTGLVSGESIGRDVNLAESGANQTASELAGINEKDYEVGRQNYDFAAEGLMKAPSVFDASTSAAGATTRQQAATADTENQIASSDNSWIQGVTGALGGIAGKVATGGMENLGSGVGFFGQNAAAPRSQG